MSLALSSWSVELLLYGS